MRYAVDSVEERSSNSYSVIILDFNIIQVEPYNRTDTTFNKGIVYGDTPDNLDKTLYLSSDSFTWATASSAFDVEFSRPELEAAKGTIWVTAYITNPETGDVIIGNVIEIAIDYPKPILLDEYVLLDGVSANTAERIHGSLLYVDYVYGSSRNETGLIRINKNDLTDTTTFQFYMGYKSDPTPPDAYKLDTFEQIQRIGDYLYMKASGFLVQFNTITEEYKVFSWYSTYNEPIVCDDSFVYISSKDDNIWAKISHQQFLDTPFSESTTIVGTREAGSTHLVYDVTSQGAHIDFPLEYPQTLPEEDIVVHASEVDDDFLYLSFTTPLNNTYGDPNTVDTTRYELHKVNKHTMEAAGWCFIPRSTDDMCQNQTHLFLGPENQIYDYYGRDMGLVYIDKLTMTPKSLKFLSSTVTSSVGFMALRFGKYLMVEYNREPSIFLLDLDTIDQWDNEEYRGQFVVSHFTLKLPNGNDAGGIPNEAVYDSVADQFYIFYWGASGENSAISKISLNSFDFSEPITVSAQYNREIASNTVSLLASITGTNEAFTLIDKGFEFDTSIGFETSQSFSIPVLDEFTIDVLDLAESTEYFYRAYLTYEGEAPILSETVSFSYTHIYGLQGKVWETLDKLVFLEGTSVGVIKMGESTIHSNLITDVNGEFRLELADGLSDYIIFGNHLDATKPIFPKRITPKIIG